MNEFNGIIQTNCARIKCNYVTLSAIAIVANRPWEVGTNEVNTALIRQDIEQYVMKIFQNRQSEYLSIRV